MPRPILLIALVILAACGKSRFPGYKPVADGLHIKLRTLGEGQRSAADSDSVLVRVRVALEGRPPGSLFSTERWYAMHDSARGFMHLVVGRLHAGDSLGVMALGDRLPAQRLGIAPGEVNDTLWYAMELSLLALRSPQESALLAMQRRMARTASDEERILSRFWADTTGGWKEFMGVRYQLDRPVPHRPPVRSGDLVTIQYAASFLDDGKVFDDTRRSGQPLTFRLGDPGQVIRGLEIALHVLPPGGKGRFVFPSRLAFGAEGSSGGIVPPFTPVMYTVEVQRAVSDTVVAGR